MLNILAKWELSANEITALRQQRKFVWQNIPKQTGLQRFRVLSFGKACE